MRQIDVAALERHLTRFTQALDTATVPLRALAVDGKELHWVRAQAITERWREGLHALVGLLGEGGVSVEYEQEERLFAVFCRHGEMTATEAARYVRGMSSAEATHLITSMVQSGRLKVKGITKHGTVRYVPL